MLSPKVKNILFVALASQLVAFVALQIIPAKPVMENQVFSCLLNSLFISLTFSFAIFSYLLPTRITKCYRIVPLKQLKFNVWISSIAAVSGLIFIFYDRVYVRGINYNDGLRAARYEWLSSTGGGFFGVSGNLMIPLSYFSLFLLIVNHKRLPKLYNFMLIFSATAGILGHAALNGGRSNVLIAVVFSLSIYLFVERRTKLNIKLNLTSLSAFILCGMFLVYMTNQSAEMAGISVKSLSKLGIESLYGIVDDDFDQFSNQVIYFIYYILTYLFHGNWTAEISYSLNATPGSYTLYPFSVILNMLGLIQQPIEPGAFSASGAFISLPGAIYYDYGFIGCLILFPLLGVIFGSAIYAIKYCSLGPIGIGLCLYPVVIMFMSPILPAYGLMYFNFIIYIFIVMGVVNKVFFRKNKNWLCNIEQLK